MATLTIRTAGVYLYNSNITNVVLENIVQYSYFEGTRLFRLKGLCHTRAREDVQTDVWKRTFANTIPIGTSGMLTFLC